MAPVASVGPAHQDVENGPKSNVEATKAKDLGCEPQPDRQSARMVTRTYVHSMFPFIVGSVIAFSYATIERLAQGTWSLNPIAYALGVHPERLTSRTYDIAIGLHVVAAFIWVGAATFQLISASLFAEEGGVWRQAHSMVGRYVAMTSMCVFLPLAIFAIIMQEKAPDVSLARYLIFDFSTNVLQAGMIVMNALVGIYKAKKKDYFAHKQLMFYSAMASLRAGSDRWGMALVQLAVPHRWLGDVTFTLGSVLGTSLVLIVSVCVACRLNALTTWASLINISCILVFIALDAFGTLEALGVF